MQDTEYDDELQTAKFEFVCAYDDGLNPNIEEWAARYPQYPELAEWFADYVETERLVALLPPDEGPLPDYAIRAWERAMRRIGIGEEIISTYSPTNELIALPSSPTHTN